MRDTIYSVEVDGQVIEASSEHPFYVQGEWKETKNLDVGDKLTLFNQDCESSIASITIEARRDTVYNLSVADFETYFVSELGILVHNCGGKVNGNSKSSKKPQHGYKITDQDDNIMEFGISGQKLKKDGTSPRIDQKLRTKYKNDPNYKGEVIEPHIDDDRAKAIDWEKAKVKQHKNDTGAAPPNQIRPKVD